MRLSGCDGQRRAQSYSFPAASQYYTQPQGTAAIPNDLISRAHTWCRWTCANSKKNEPGRSTRKKRLYRSVGWTSASFVPWLLQPTIPHDVSGTARRRKRRDFARWGRRRRGKSRKKAVQKIDADPGRKIQFIINILISLSQGCRCLFFSSCSFCWIRLEKTFGQCG